MKGGGVKVFIAIAISLVGSLLALSGWIFDPYAPEVEAQTSVAATPDERCPNGFFPSGSRCKKEVNPTTINIQRCPSGYNPSNVDNPSECYKSALTRCINSFMKRGFGCYKSAKRNNNRCPSRYFEYNGICERYHYPNPELRPPCSQFHVRRSFQYIGSRCVILTGTTDILPLYTCSIGTLSVTNECYLPYTTSNKEKYCLSGDRLEGSRCTTTRRIDTPTRSCPSSHPTKIENLFGVITKCRKYVNKITVGYDCRTSSHPRKVGMRCYPPLRNGGDDSNQGGNEENREQDEVDNPDRDINPCIGVGSVGSCDLQSQEDNPSKMEAERLCRERGLGAAFKLESEGIWRCRPPHTEDLVKCDGDEVTRDDCRTVPRGTNCQINAAFTELRVVRGRPGTLENDYDTCFYNCDLLSDDTFIDDRPDYRCEPGTGLISTPTCRGAQVLVAGICTDPPTDDDDDTSGPERNCPTGQRFNTATNRCQTIICSTGYTLIGDDCVRKPNCIGQQLYRSSTNTCIDPVCVGDQRLVNKSCVNPTCSGDQIVVNGVCTNPPTPTCPAGYTWRNSRCELVPLNCPNGYSQRGSTCVRTPTSTTIEEPVAEITPPEANCPTGFIFVGGRCESISTGMVCPDGFTAVNSLCVETDDVGSPGDECTEILIRSINLNIYPIGLNRDISDDAKRTATHPGMSAIFIGRDDIFVGLKINSISAVSAADGADGTQVCSNSFSAHKFSFYDEPLTYKNKDRVRELSADAVSHIMFDDIEERISRYMAPGVCDLASSIFCYRYNYIPGVRGRFTRDISVWGLDGDGNCLKINKAGVVAVPHFEVGGNDFNTLNDGTWIDCPNHTADNGIPSKINLDLVYLVKQVVVVN